MQIDPRTDPRTDALGDRSRRAGLGLALATGLLASTVLLSGCGDDGVAGPGVDDDSPEQAPGSQLTFLSPSPDAPPLMLGDSDGDGLGDTTIVATRGQEVDLEIFHQDPENPDERGERFLELELEENSLLRYPDDHPHDAGRAFQSGDTIHITVAVASDTLLTDFGPPGLQFDPGEPAELEMRWTNAEEDTDEDGEDDLDEREGELDLWKQEAPGEDWFRSGDVKDVERDRLRAFVESFTRFAMAI